MHEELLAAQLLYQEQCWHEVTDRVHESENANVLHPHLGQDRVARQRLAVIVKNRGDVRECDEKLKEGDRSEYHQNMRNAL